MKKLLLILFLLTPSTFIFGQQNEHDEDQSDFFPIREKKVKSECGTRVQIADSVVSFSYNATTGTTTPVRVQHYSYDADYNLTEILAISLPARTLQFRQIFEYDINGNLLKYTYFSWVNGEWQPDLINNRTYDNANHILTEDFQRKNTAGEFVAYQRHFYNYAGNIIINYLRQVKNTAGEWYDFSHHYYVYDSMGRLIVLYGQYISSGLIFWERTAIFDTDGLVSERYLKILRYNFTLKKNVLTNDTYQKNFYNIYRNVTEIQSFGFTNNQWTFTGMDSTYYSMMPNGTKVSICHNGKSICISINALKAHLEHGDKLGQCDSDLEKGKGEKEIGRIGDKDGIGKDDLKFTIYPNPAKTFLSIRMLENDNSYKSGLLLSPAGQVLRSFSIEGQNEITLDISGLLDGTYFVKMMKSDGSDTRTVIKK